MGNARSKSCSFVAVLIPQAEGGCFVQCPTLPGCYSQGETAEESLANMREAINLLASIRRTKQVQVEAISNAFVETLTPVNRNLQFFAAA